MKFKLTLLVCLLVLAGLAVAQTSLGTITGIVADPTGAVIANASVEAKNTETGVIYRGTSTTTGNYTIQQLPLGPYEVTVNLQGFKKYTHQNMTIVAGQVLREDVTLALGSNTESVTVTAESTLLKTENSELAHNVTIRQLDNLPILPVNGGGVSGLSSSGFRDPFSLTQLIPGTQYGASGTIVVNNLPNTSENILVEGQMAGATQSGGKGFTHQTQPSVDAIQEVAVQTSNFAAEFGMVGGGIFNITMKSGTNQYHGSVYDYAVNDVLNAQPAYFGGTKASQKRHDYGGTLGGPIKIPHVYNGENKTFFFFNFEQYRENGRATNTSGTVPTTQYRSGDFSCVQAYAGTNSSLGGVPAIFNNCAAGSFTPKLTTIGSGKCDSTTTSGCYLDPLGRQLIVGTVFDPRSTAPFTCNTAQFPGSDCNNGNTGLIRNPFVGQQVPSSLFDPVALRILNLVPLPQGPNALSGTRLDQNWQTAWPGHRTSQIPSVKIDHQLSSKAHLAFYWGNTVTESQYSAPNGNSIGLPPPIDPARGTFIYSPTERLNYDHTLTPSVLLHVGVGYNGENFWDWPPVQDFNATLPQGTCSSPAVSGYVGTALCTGGLGWKATTPGGLFPGFNAGTGLTGGGLGASTFPGGMSTTGPAGGIHSSGFTEHRPSANANVTYVKRSHTIKLGTEWYYAQIPTQNLSNTSGQWTFGGGTAQIAAQNPASSITTGLTPAGFGLADFLMGDVTAITLSAPADSSLRKYQLGLFLQDTWKITRKLTLDYGLRWDYGSYAREQYGRSSNFSAITPNPSAGGHPGAQIYEATCNCQFASAYPFAIGPRVGFAYQINSKTVIRGGVGIVYGLAGSFGGSINNGTAAPSVAFGQVQTNSDGSPAPLQNGLPNTVVARWPDTSNPALGQALNAVVGAPAWNDPNSGRPMRQWQYNFTVQREVSRNFVIEAAYVGNRVNWLAANLTPQPNDLSVPYLNSLNFFLPATGANTGSKSLDSSLLGTTMLNLTPTQLGQLAAKNIGFSPLGPYPGFPITSQNVRQALKAFPQYSSGPTSTGAPQGKTWYDALQVTATKRLSHGLSVNANYTYSKSLNWTDAGPDVFNNTLGKDLSPNDLPHQFRLSADYTTPRIHSGNKILGNKVVAAMFSNWGTGWFLQYQSARVIGLPGGNGSDPIVTALGRGNLVANHAVDANGNQISPWSVNWYDNNGVHHTDPLDINCKCYNPQTTVVLNPAAWTLVNNGQWSNDYSTPRDYRGFRSPQENVNFSRNFRIKERVNLTLRVEFANAFNRTRLSAATFATGTFSTPLSCSSGTSNSTSAGAAGVPVQCITPTGAGVNSAGFGTLVVPAAGLTGARTGNLVVRLNF